MSRLGPTGLTQLLTNIKTWVTTKLGNYVTTDTVQTVTGKKYFTNSTTQVNSVNTFTGSTLFIDTSASAPRGSFPESAYRVGRIYIGDGTSYNGSWFIIDPTIDTNRAYYRMVTTNPDNTDSTRFTIEWNGTLEGVRRRRNISMGDLLPQTASTYNLGESGNAWQDAYINKIHGISDYTNLKTNIFNVNTTLTHGGSGRRVILAMGAITLTVPAPEEGSWFLIKAVNGLVTLNLASNVTVTGITAGVFSGPIHLQPNESILLCYYSSTTYNATISTIRRSGVVGRTGNVPSENPKHWFKIAENYVTATYRDPFICLKVFESTTGNTIGTLCAHCRINNTVGVVDTSNCYLQWQDAGAGFNLSKYALTTNETSGTGVTISLWCQLTGGYSSLKFEVVSECGQSDQLGNPEWVLTRRRQTDGDLAELSDTDFTKIVYSTLTTLKNDTTGKASNVTGTVAIANGGTGATTRLNAVKNLTNESVGTPTHFLAITTNWGKAGYTTVAQAKTVLGVTGDIVSHNASEFLTASGNETVTGTKIFNGDKIVITQGNGYRMVCNTDGGSSGYGVFQRVDSANWYLMVTAQNDALGTWTTARPASMNLSTGVLSINGNAATATQFSANKDVTLTGDVTGTASSKAGWSVATTLANSGVTAGTYGPSADVTGSNNATILVPEITVDAKGRVTAVNNRTYTSVNTDNDKKVYQYYKSDNDVYRLLFSNNAGNTATSNVGAVYSGLNNSFYVNPSTGALYATKLYSNGVEVLTAHQSLSNYVTLNTAQEITNTKTFKDATAVRKLTSVEAGNVIPSSDKLISDIWQDKNGKELGRIYYVKSSGGNTALVMRAGDWFSESEGVYSLNASGTNRRAELHLYSDSSGNCCIKPVGYFSATLKALSTSVWLGESTKPFGRVYANAFEFCNASLLPDTDVQTSEEHSIGFYGRNNTPLSYITFQKRPNLKDRIAVRIQTAASTYKSYCFDATCFYPESSNSVDIGSTTNIFKNIYCNNYYKGTTAFGDIVTHNASEFLTSHQSLSSCLKNSVTNNQTIKSTAITRGTAPSSTQTFGIAFSDNNDKYIGNVYGQYATNKATYVGLYAYKGTTTANGDNVSVRVGYDASGNAYTYAPTPATADNSTQIATTAFVKAQGYLTSHPSITLSTNTTSTESPSHGGTFTCIDSVTQDANGHITKVNTKTITLPADSNTDTKVTQTVTTANSAYPVLLCTTANATSTGTTTSRFTAGLTVNTRYSSIYMTNKYDTANTKGVRNTSNYSNGILYFRSYDETQMGTIRCESNKGGYQQIYMQASNYIKNGAIDPEGTSTTCLITVRVRDNGGKAIYTDGAWENSLTPYADNTHSLGTSSNKWKVAHAVNFYENGTALSSKYAQIANISTNGIGTTCLLAYFPENTTDLSLLAGETKSGTSLYVVYWWLESTASVSSNMYTNSHATLAVNKGYAETGTWKLLHSMSQGVTQNAMIGVWVRIA